MKQIARMENLAKRNSLSGAKLEKKSRLITESLLALPEFRQAKRVMMYFPLKNEAGTSELVKKTLEMGKEVFLPKTDFGKRLIVPTRVSSPEALERTAQGLVEPKDGQAARASELDLIIVPGVAFDRQGNRIGMGRGFYDLLLRKVSRKVKLVGLCFEENLEESLPVESHDVKMDLIVTDKQVIRRGQ